MGKFPLIVRSLGALIRRAEEGISHAEETEEYDTSCPDVHSSGLLGVFHEHLRGPEAGGPRAGRFLAWLQQTGIADLITCVSTFSFGRFGT